MNRGMLPGECTAWNCVYVCWRQLYKVFCILHICCKYFSSYIGQSVLSQLNDAVFLIFFHFFFLHSCTWSAINFLLFVFINFHFLQIPASIFITVSLSTPSSKDITCEMGNRDTWTVVPGHCGAQCALLREVCVSNFLSFSWCSKINYFMLHGLSKWINHEVCYIVWHRVVW